MRVERLMIPGPAGELEALLESPSPEAPKMTALVCHPHPVYGGTMHNKVVFRAAKSALGLGFPTLRFNFRGAGKSTGQFDKGRGEREDVRAALNFLAGRFPGAPVCLMGFSFGSWVGLSVGVEDERVRALVGLGLPLVDSDFRYLSVSPKPKLIIQGTRDQYGARLRVEALFQSLVEPKRLHLVEGADHFFAGKLDEVQDAIRGFLQEFAP